MHKIYLTTLVLASLISLAFTEMDFYFYLDKAIEQTEGALTRSQLSALNAVRRILNSLEDVDINEPYFNAQYWHYDIAIRMYLSSTGQLGAQEAFEQFIRNTCIEVNGYWDSVFNEYYRRRSMGYGSWSAIRRRDPSNFYMVLNAAFCYNGYNQYG